MTYYIGVDPDLHHAGVAILSPPNVIHYLGVARVGKSFKQEDAAAEMAMAFDSLCLELDILHNVGLAINNKKHIIVESQDIYPGSKVRAQDLIPLAQVAGVAMGVLCQGFTNISSNVFVKPRDWKGQVQKEPQHKMIEDYVGWYPPSYLSIKPSEMPHVFDAIGLALWGMLRDLLPRSPDRAGDSTTIRGNVLSKQRLDRMRDHYQRHPAPPL